MCPNFWLVLHFKSSQLGFYCCSSIWDSIKDYAASVTDYFSECVGNVISFKIITMCAIHRPYMTAEVCALLKTWHAAFRSDARRPSSQQGPVCPGLSERWSATMQKESTVISWEQRIHAVCEKAFRPPQSKKLHHMYVCMWWWSLASRFADWVLCTVHRATCQQDRPPQLPLTKNFVCPHVLCI